MEVGPKRQTGTVLVTETVTVTIQRPRVSPALTALRLSNLRAAPRCLARTRSGGLCQCAALKGRPRCRLHGSAPGAGGQKGEQNGRYKHGAWTCEAIALRRRASTVWKRARALVADA